MPLGPDNLGLLDGQIYQPGKEKVTYVKMTAEKVARVVGEHLVGGKPVDEYTIGAVQK